MTKTTIKINTNDKSMFFKSCKLGIIVIAIDNTRYKPIQVFAAEKFNVENEVLTKNSALAGVKSKSIKFAMNLFNFCYEFVKTFY